MPIQRVREYVKQYDASLEPLVFAESLKTSAEAAAVLGVEVGQIAKSILFRSEDTFGLFVTAGDVKVPPKQLKLLLGGKKPKMATPEEVELITGFRVGAVCPFALQENIPVYIDTSMQRFDRVFTAAGIIESALPITYEQLKHITNGIEFDTITA
ncbi:YbaK/EbsC family protein [Ectobacillus ponti]|uniref:YbaK/EbsC family protein n=1 Tax=Ectobacillus ponti TaxID=2961894 RepID=A0AA41XB58_9BACI|nr:YbaK/EbsC family protein [Ectobacillus ponti]MCP8969638.1 YbaK/EbsC family protein [Ectobacillus ponti]